MICPADPAYVPFGRMQELQLKKSGFRAVTALVFGSLCTDISNAVRTSLLLNDAQLLWLNTLNASKRSSSFTLSAFGMLNVLCRDASNLTKGEPLPALLSRFPFASRNVTA